MLHAMEIAIPAPYLSLIALVTSSQAGSLREDTTTLAPCSAIRSAMARPMPRDEPVMTATLPFKSNNSGIENLHHSCSAITLPGLSLSRHREALRASQRQGYFVALEYP